MKIEFIHHQNLKRHVKFLCITLAIFILSALFFAPIPVLALDYNGRLNSYISNVKADIDGIVTSIKNLPSLSYENGKTTLAEIDTRLEKIQTDAARNVAEFQKLSDQAQHNYEYFLQLETLKQQAKEKRRLIMQSTVPQDLWSQIDLDSDKIFLRYELYQPEPVASYASDLRNLEKNINFAKARIREISQTDYEYVSQLEDMQGKAREQRRLIMQSTVSQDLWPQIDLDSDKIFQRYELYYPEPVASYARELRNLEKNINFVKARLKESSLNLSNGIVLANNISKLCDVLQKRINLATQKFGNVKDYASALNSFSDPDVLNEIGELDKMIADLTQTLSLSA
ncbi:hypothetical protein HCG51_07190 [Tolypothrix sp. PCC 7910]|uniref:hypothetical protein n=1 Tax=Tolypothrix sp. PCC 7910 TaxID=2099387 RepID=UPI001427963A|nr:hypothetical protein [Tolypothrix sp. PCC 7910]QIR36557.1 hypothetical protein HCG51_07190 [Tolypothrix sp. PCC 7910]